jgi:hypothetical protein
MSWTNLSTVMPGFMPGIHVLWLCNTKDVDGRDKSGHDERRALCPAMTNETHCVSTVMPGTNLTTVMPALVAGIHVLTTSMQDVARA